MTQEHATAAELEEIAFSLPQQRIIEVIEMTATQRKQRVSVQFADTIAALHPLTAVHDTKFGQRTGFLMTDAARVLGGALSAQNELVTLLVEGLAESDPVIIDGEVCTLFRLVDVPLPRN